jgi:hypothetical protein
MNYKVGIVTLYSNNYNYGAHLQAFALQWALKSIGVDSEIIDYDWNAYYKPDAIDKNPSRTIKGFFKNIYSNILYGSKFKSRKDAFDSFDKHNIKISSQKYDARNIEKANIVYDAFVTGSDQVWRLIDRDPKANDAFLLNFTNKIKMSYAASIGLDHISEELSIVFKNALSSIDYVSVRERSGNELLSKIVNRDIETVLDPTLLLTKEQWNLVKENYSYPNNYIFCYFLSSDERERRFATKLSHELHTPIISLSHLRVNYRRYDEKFNSIKLYDVSPGKFISLIENASVVLTDSFHAAVFSTIYEKEFFVFNRGEKKNSAMINRLKDFLTGTGQGDKLIDSYNDILPLCNTDFSQARNYISMEREKSFAFLSQIKYEI